jgi:hypothetical protein
MSDTWLFVWIAVMVASAALWAFFGLLVWERARDEHRKMKWRKASDTPERDEHQS